MNCITFDVDEIEIYDRIEKYTWKMIEKKAANKVDSEVCAVTVVFLFCFVWIRENLLKYKSNVIIQ